MSKEVVIIIELIITSLIITIADVLGLLKSYQKGLWYSLFISFTTIMFTYIISNNVIRIILAFISVVSMIVSVVFCMMLIKSRKKGRIK